MIGIENEYRHKTTSHHQVVPESWNIPTEIRERFGETAGRQRAMNADGHLLLVLHEPPGPDDLGRTAKLLWRDPNGSWCCSTDGSVENLLKKHVAEFSRLAEQLEDQLQCASCARNYFDLLQSIAPLHRASRNLHTTLQQAREMIPDDHEIIAARDAASDAERAFELIYVDAKNALDFTIAEKAELQSQRSFEMAKSAHRLNVLAALFFPITAVSSIFGMNFASGLEWLPAPFMFWTILGLGSLGGVCVLRTMSDNPAENRFKLDSAAAVRSRRCGKKS